MTDEAVKRQIEGVCDEISEKNGWTTFSINVGSQYPVRLSTKLPALIEQGRAAGQQRAVWSFKESQGKENPNKPGTHFTNRYLDSVEVGGTATVSSGSAPSGAKISTSDETRGSIERQVIVKAAMPLYPAGLITTDAEFFALLAKLEAFCADGAVAPEVKADDDDDIPFA